MNENELLPLEEIAESILGKEYLGYLSKWFQNSLQEDCKYVVYTVRRGYLLALIMEKVTKTRIPTNGEKIYLTDAAFLLRAQELADWYRIYHEFPKTIMYDENLIHGRNFNGILQALENRLLNLLSDFSMEEIQEALMQAISFRVCFKASDEPILLMNRYENKYYYLEQRTITDCRKISNMFSELVMSSGMANAVYVFSEKINGCQFATIPKNEFIKTEYQNHTQYTKINVIKEKNFYKAIMSVRIIENRYSNVYRAVPFVILPNLGKLETERLIESILSFIPDELYQTSIREWFNIEGLRSVNELITLILSNAILQDFNQKYGITIGHDDDYNEEINKLMRNYDQHGYSITVKMLDDLIKKYVISLDEVKDIILNSVNEDKYVVRTSDFLTDMIDESQQKQIVEQLENELYKYSCEDEKDVCILKNDKNILFRSCSERRAVSSSMLLRTLFDGCSHAELLYAVAYLQQMMDAGILSMSTFSPRNIKVVGYSQFAKAGEQSLLLYPLRVYKYIPMLAEVQKYCIREYVDWKEQYECILEKFETSGKSSISSLEWQKIYKFVEHLFSIEQYPEGWNRSYISKIQFDEDFMTGVMKLLSEQKKYQSEVMEFLNT